MIPVSLYPHFRPFLLSPAWLLLQTQQLWAQKLGQGDGGEGVDLWQVVGALAICITVAIAAAFILRSRIQGGAILRLNRHTRRLQLVEKLRVGAQNDICIVSYDGEEMLVASSSRDVQLLRPMSPSRGNPAP